MNERMLAQMAGGDGPPAFAPMLLVGALFAIFYFTVIYPQNKKEREKAREKQEFRDRLKKGDEVIAAGGLYGRVVELKGSVVSLELAPNVRVRVELRTIEPLVRLGKASEEKESSGS
jgi:preprotein translocase subunit YajC